MSAFGEFDKERQEIDGLISRGYRVIRIIEDLDGTTVRFRHLEPGGAPVELQLLTADARKHVTTLMLGGSKSAAPSGESYVI
ncbi:hypothetical protein [Paenibacillus sp. MMS20-IR301]|uniref:hypothetical protein n=1 Tax=Paenibacillus sp. MMS20-IR301 TaxID=2895946 RepID=UPI0028E5D324|nr:hypothetical protein [Paenibacillus sp. MMS20-IR301]WNS42523.1 hypothetical protein LOS79_26615 [Paenibacillus sp. MMS20-IR301]